MLKIKHIYTVVWYESKLLLYVTILSL